jgi:adenylate kinase
MTHVIIMGPQGAGKGTQAAVIAPALSLVHLSTGDLFRQVMAGDSELGREIRRYVDQGALVPDDLTIRMLMERLDQSLQEQPKLHGALLDGFPRNLAQAEALSRAMDERGDRIAAVIHVDAPRDVLMARLTGRLVCPNCGTTYHREFNPPAKPGICDVCGSELIQRSDDTPEAVTRRLAIYDEQTAPVLAYYRKADLLVDVNGDQPIESVTRAILAQVQSRLGGVA